MPKKLHEAKITITETTVQFQDKPKKSIRVNIDGRQVAIPVDDGVYAHWKNQFFREKPSPEQKKRFATGMNLIRTAYLQGLQDRNWDKTGGKAA